MSWVQIPPPQFLFINNKEENLRKGLNIIRLIDKRDLHFLIDNGYINGNTLKGVTVTSRGKKSKSKHYYTQDHLAFTAWEAQGLNPDDADFQKWKKRNNKRRK